MNKYHLTGLSVIGGLMSGFAWSDWCPGLILLISFVPFLLIEDHLYRHREKYWVTDYLLFILPGLFIFNILALGWIRVASIYSAVAVITGISLLMSFTLWITHVIRIKAGNKIGIMAFVTFWMAFEYLTLNTSLLTPWINLGNGLAKNIFFIQWYELTGVSGGTLWILISNLLLTGIIIIVTTPGKKLYLWLIIWFAVLAVPSIFSGILYATVEDNSAAANEVIIIQPNIDPYTEKYNMPFEDQLDKVLAMAENNITDRTEWIITPETTVDDPVDEKDPAGNRYIIKIRKIAELYPSTSIVAGLVSFREQNDTVHIENGSKGSSKPWRQKEYYNSAFQIDTADRISIYHKSRLVPGIEKHLLSAPGKLLSRILPELGGTSWGYTPQDERSCFTHPATGHSAAPIVCYESVFGEYVTDYVVMGANMLFIITNDGWWKNTTGYRQHLDYASLRAIETRRPVARAANTGISCIIDIRGKRLIESPWWEEDVVKGSIGSETRITLYVRYGDYLMRIAAFSGLLILLYVFIALPFRKKTAHNI